MKPNSVAQQREVSIYHKWLKSVETGVSGGTTLQTEEMVQ
jgi:hypothetical protein